MNDYLREQAHDGLYLGEVPPQVGNREGGGGGGRRRCPPTRPMRPDWVCLSVGQPVTLPGVGSESGGGPRPARLDPDRASRRARLRPRPAPPVRRLGRVPTDGPAYRSPRPPA